MLHTYLKKFYVAVSTIAVIGNLSGIGAILSVAYAASSFTATVQGPTAVTSGNASALTLSVTNGGAQVSGAIADLEIDNSSGQRVFQQFFENQNFGTNERHDYSISWTPSATGSYTVKTGVFATGWSSLLLWNDNALSISVASAPSPAVVSASGFLSMGSVSPSTVASGGRVTLSGNVKNTGSSPIAGAIVMLQVYNSATGAEVFKKAFAGANFAPGEMRNYATEWIASVQGDYGLSIGVFGANWSGLLSWTSGVAKIKVATNATVAPVAPSTSPTPAPTHVLATTPTITPTPTLATSGFYVNPNSPAAAAALSTSNPADAARLHVIANAPQGTWFGNWNSNVFQDVKNLVDAASAAGTTPVLVTYNIPQRDCGGFSAGGANNPDGYRAWLQSFANGIGSRHALVILEPDALAGIDCLSSTDQATRRDLLSFAVNTLKSLGNTSVYLDAGNANWVSADQMASRLSGANVSRADGFALNTSNFVSTPPSVSYGTAISSLIGNKHFVIDTSRNGAGAAPNGEWCNPSGRALGALPTRNTGNPLVDAFLWAKRPGESDGPCNGGPSAGVFWPAYAIGLAANAGY